MFEVDLKEFIIENSNETHLAKLCKYSHENALSLWKRLYNKNPIELHEWVFIAEWLLTVASGSIQKWIVDRMMEHCKNYDSVIRDTTFTALKEMGLLDKYINY